MTVYNLEYCTLDAIDRPQGFKHYNVYATLDEVEVAQKEILTKAQEQNKNVRFNIYPIDNLFERITQS